MGVSRVEAALKAITVEAAVPAAIVVGSLQAARLPLQLLDQSVRMKSGQFCLLENYI
jgi:hypothetical protein